MPTRATEQVRAIKLKYGNGEIDSSGTLFDVIATDIKTGKRRIMDTDKTGPNAEVISLAVMRLGVEKEFYSAVAAGSVRSE